MIDVAEKIVSFPQNTFLIMINHKLQQNLSFNTHLPDIASAHTQHSICRHIILEQHFNHTFHITFYQGVQ
jgi:hypothetical protein